MEIEGLAEIIFTLVIIAISAIVVLAQKSAAKQTKTRFEREEEMRRMYAATWQKPHPQPAGYQPPREMTEEEAHAREALRRYEEATSSQISPEAAPVQALPELEIAQPSPITELETLPEMARIGKRVGLNAAAFFKANPGTAIVMKEILDPPLALRQPGW